MEHYRMYYVHFTSQQERLMRLPMAPNIQVGQDALARGILCNRHFLYYLPTLVFHTITHNTSHLHLYLATSPPHYLNTSYLTFL